MQPRAALALFSAAAIAAPADAQETVTCSLSWIEVNAGTSIPVAGPNGVVDPGEGARIRVTTLITPGIGSPVTYQAPPAPGHGTIAGLGSIFVDLLQNGALGGSWSVLRSATTTGWPPHPSGTTLPDGSLIATGVGNFVLPGTVPNSTNPWENVWQGTWTPSTYAPRTAGFQSAGAAAGQGNHSSILIQYGVDPNTGAPLIVGRFIGGVFGNTGPIPIVPSPAAGVVLGLCALAAGRRRRVAGSALGATP